MRLHLDEVKWKNKYMETIKKNAVIQAKVALSRQIREKIYLKSDLLSTENFKKECENCFIFQMKC